MIRQPTPTSVALAWWREALRNPDTVRHDGDPQCGWYKRRMVKGGPFVAARIYLDRDIDPMTGELTCPEELRCEVDGLPRDPADQWTYLQPISRADYDALLHLRGVTPEMFDARTPIDLTRKPLWIP